MTMTISNHPLEHEELMAYLDGELSADRAAEAAEHLEQCPQCRQLAADFQEISEMVAAWQVDEAEREPAKNVVEALEKSPSQKVPSPAAVSWRRLMNPLHWPKPVWGLAGAAIVAFAMLTPAVFRPRYRFGQIRELKTEVQDGAVDSNGQLYPYASSSKDRAPALPKPPAPQPRRGTSGKLQTEDEISVEAQESPEPEGNASNVPAIKGPMIIRTAELEVTTDAFDKARPAVEDVLKRHHGYIGELNVNTPTNSARSLTGTLRVPANQLDATLSDLKNLGRTEQETQGGQEVTQQYVDLEARLANSKHTEQRLVEMLRDRTGKLSDVLAVEMQISRVRGEIEEMEAQRKTMKGQVDYATISVTLSEAYKAKLKAVPPSTGTRLRNAAIHGYKSLVDGIIALLMWLLSAGPTLLVWAAVLFFPARYAWKRLKPRFVQE